MVVRWQYVVRESTVLGKHNTVVKWGIKYDMILFIVSEIMFFLYFGFS